MDNEIKSTITTICESFGSIIGFIGNSFLWSVALFFAYKWFSWNFNLPEATYLEVVAIYTSSKIICNLFGTIFHHK